MEKISTQSLYLLYKEHPIITTDTRNCPAGSLFFALKGERFNANQFAAQALEAGSAFAIIDEPEYATDSRFLLVDDVLTALQDLAAYHRAQLTIPIIGITGTNGKTTTKELTKAVLSTRFNTLATEGNLNNHIGVPLTLLKIRPEHEMAIIEMGANHPGEIAFLCNIANPDFGLITNVGKAHLEGFGSLEGVIRTKTELYSSLRRNGGKLFLHFENEYLKPHATGLECYTYGETPDLYLSGKLTGCTPFLAFSFTHEGVETEVQTQLIGAYNLTNALVAAAIGTRFDVPAESIKAGLEQYSPSNKRSQLVKTEKNTLILDTYNANPTSMRAALLNFKAMEVPNKMLILGGMRELGAESAAEHAGIIVYIGELGFDNVVLVGDEFNTLHHSYTALADANALKGWIAEHPVTDHYILVKGSRGIALETGIEGL